MIQNASSRQIDVNSSVHGVSYLDVEGNKRSLGRLQNEDYSGEGRRLLFTPSEDNPFVSKKHKNYALGFGSKHLDFIDPSEAQSVMMDSGAIIKDQVAIRGGLQMKTTYIFPDTAIPDPLKFDEDVWQQVDDRALWFGCILTTSLQVGAMAAVFDMGLWRKICSNGMTAKILGFPAFSFKHSEWDVSKVREQVTEAITDSKGNLNIRGPLISRAGALVKGISVLKKYVELNKLTPDDVDPDEDDFEGEEGTPVRRKLVTPVEYQVLESQFKAISPNMLKPRVLFLYLQMLDRLVDGHDANDPIYAMDLACAYTSSVNIYRAIQSTDRGAFRAMAATNGVLNLTTTLASLATLFSEN